MKIIRFQKPKIQQADVRYCDLCSAQPTFHTKNLAYFLCSDCATKFDAKSLTIIPDNHISQVCAHKPVQTKPIRSRKRDYVRFERNLQACRAQQSLVSDAERQQAEITSAKMLKANNRLLKKHFEPSS